MTRNKEFNRILFGARKQGRHRAEPASDLVKVTTGAAEAVVGIAAMTAVTSVATQLIKKTQ